MAFDGLLPLLGDDPNLKPIVCVHSSIEPVNVISNAFINDQLFETIEPS